LRGGRRALLSVNERRRQERCQNQKLYLLQVKTPRASLWKQRTTMVIEGLGPSGDC
jgi:hypothetical protein